MKGGTFAAYLSRNAGRTFLDLVHEARLKRAERLLSSTDASVGKVARAVRYENVGFFYRLFKVRFGEMPTAHRRRDGVR
jgi:Response regulator containing CheY-like receiver domain and AraC-type DNA-binding domain